jgi:hypothetical protein
VGSDTRTGSIPVCGMIVNKRNVDFVAFLLFFCLQVLNTLE